uniref:Uncharacterized protein n=1 Tax=Myripristis murdjan TaxID=586833 RepID=A0A667YR30_9TELE
IFFTPLYHSGSLGYMPELLPGQNLPDFPSLLNIWQVPRPLHRPGWPPSLNPSPQRSFLGMRWLHTFGCLPYPHSQPRG